MKRLCECDVRILSDIQVVLCDLDDTLTLNGKLPAAAYAALEAIQDAGRTTVVVTGRPAGWCDLIARLWPVDGVIGENGAFYFRYDTKRKQMERRFLRSNEQRLKDRKRLLGWFIALQEEYPAIRLAADQDFRISDIAIDVCEDIVPLSDSEVAALMSALTRYGATVKLSSIHVNAWIGQFDKLSMSKTYLSDELGIAEHEMAKRVLFIGDSPNDEPMFRFFKVTVGVQNIKKYIESLECRPAFVTDAPGGTGFAEMVRLLGTAASA